MNVLLIDDHPLYRTGFQTALTRASSRFSVLTAGTVTEAVTLLHSDPDIAAVIIDWHLSGDDGLSALRQIGQHFPGVARVLISGDDDPAIAAVALREGASGFVPKSFTVEQIVGALDVVLAGELFVPMTAMPTAVSVGSLLNLTLRQLEVISMLSHGLSNKEIARELQLAERTVKAHLTGLFVTLGVSNRTQAVLAAQRRGLLPPS